MEESIVERVLILMKDYELTASEFADKIDVQRSSMSHLVSGRNKPSLDFIQKILNNFSDLNPTWLIMGTGPMKQLDLFDNKGDIAPIQPIPAENFHVDLRVAARATALKSPVAEKEPERTNNNKVVYAQSLPTAAVVPEPIEADVQQHMPIEQPTIQATIPPITAPVMPVAPNPPIPIQQPASVVNTPEFVNTLKTTQEAVVQTEKSVQNDKKVVKIVFFYSDNTFESFNPQ